MGIGSETRENNKSNAEDGGGKDEDGRGERHRASIRRVSLSFQRVYMLEERDERTLRVVREVRSGAFEFPRVGRIEAGAAE